MVDMVDDKPGRDVISSALVSSRPEAQPKVHA